MNPSPNSSSGAPLPPNPKPALDDRAQRMVEFLAEGRYANARALQQLRLTLLLWVIRNKLTGSMKRAFDVALGAVALGLLSPIMLVAAIAVKLDTPGPVIFYQKRLGKWGKPFDCYKFRSMYVDAEARKAELSTLNEADQVIFKMKRDPRITRVGYVLRKLSIDELPQLVNVLKGDMSLVGPRPPVPVEVAQYSYMHLQRLDAIPGITGLQQVSGRSDLTFRRWIELDLQYINEQSLLSDIRILLSTIPAVISGKGAY
jgi:lipopolysaccharide/colanic/teichoic acid biosynthesis glycosyltransferase